MKTRSLLVLLATCAFAQADMEVTQTVVSTPLKGEPTKQEIKMEMKGSKVRLDVSSEASVIMDLKSGEMTSLIHAQKLAMTVDAKKLKEMAAAAESQPGGKIKASDLKPTGKVEKINGYEAEEYAGMEGDARLSVWISKDLPNQKELMAQMAEFQKLQPQLAQGGGIDYEKLPGYPLRTELASPKMGTVRITVNTIAEKPLPDSNFAIPSGYKPLQMPTMPR